MVQQLLDANGELPPEVPRSANIQVRIPEQGLGCEAERDKSKEMQMQKLTRDVGLRCGWTVLIYKQMFSGIMFDR